MNFLYLLVLALLLVVQTNVTAPVNCGPGFMQDKHGCEDYDECEEEKEERCGNNSVCYNTLGSYYCQCEPGYKAKSFNFTLDKGGPCQDINECEAIKSICGPNADCSNIAGSYYCSCATGFVASNGQEHFNASQDVTCEVIQTSVTASVNCGIGYVQNKDGCEDYDECEEEKEERCGNNSVCYNTEGSYYCQCEPGYKAKSFNFTAAEGGSCQDINECVDIESICGPNAVCFNIAGSYYCSCDTGFVASNRQEHLNTSQDVTCNDINECWENKSICGPNAVCFNIPGSYYCSCDTGFVASNGQEQFKARQSVTCNVIQTSVTASVNCGTGYVQNKDGCEDYDECEEEKEERCGNNSVCYNTLGSYYCQCEPGYKAKSFNFTAVEGGSCKDINECVENKTICGPNAVCFNIAGSYYCSCAPGFEASNRQEHLNTSQDVTCEETKRSSEYVTLCVPEADKSSARERQRFNRTLLTFLLVSHWILKTY